jgi:hypothetical protein
MLGIARGTAVGFASESKTLRGESLLKNPQTYRFVTGHDFSRADKANQINRALAPAVGLDKPV